MTGESAESQRREEAGGAALLEAFEEEAVGDEVGEEQETSGAIEALDAAQGKRRFLVMAGVGIPVAALVAVGVAMLIHVAVAGGFLAAWWWGAKAGHGQGAGGQGVSTGGDGFVVMDLEGRGGKTTAKEQNVDPVEAMKGTEKAPAAPVKLPAALTAAPAAPAARVEEAVPTVIAVGPRAVDPVGEVKTPVPAVQVVRAAAPVQQTSVAPKNVVASVTPKQVAVGGKDAGEEIVNPGGTAEGSGTGEEAVDIMGPGYKGLGSGSGSGKGRGGGLDRGPSGADNPEPQVLEQPALTAPASAILHPPKRDTVFRVEVLASGKVGKVVLKQSSGNQEVDDSCRVVVLTSKYRPAYVGGESVTRTMEQSFTFGTGTE